MEQLILKHNGAIIYYKNTLLKFYKVMATPAFLYIFKTQTLTKDYQHIQVAEMRSVHDVSTYKFINQR